MGIKIWHQSFTVLSDLGAYDEALKAHFRKIARPDTVIDMHGMQPGTYRSNYPGDDIKHVALQYIHGLQFLTAGVRAEREGYDAYAISTLPEPALRETRATVDIPVLGYGESAMLAACTLGRKFGVLVFIDELAELVAENAQRHGLGSRFAGAHHVGFRFADVLAAFDQPDNLIERFYVAARRLIAQGADVIIPGEAPMNVLLARSGVNEVDGVPVLDSLSTWVKQAETMVDMRRANGTKTARNGYFTRLPDPDRIDEVLDFYGLADKFGLKSAPATGDR